MGELTQKQHNFVTIDTVYSVAPLILTIFGTNHTVYKGFILILYRKTELKIELVCSSPDWLAHIRRTQRKINRDSRETVASSRRAARHRWGCPRWPSSRPASQGPPPAEQARRGTSWGPPQTVQRRRPRPTAGGHAHWLWNSERGVSGIPPHNDGLYRVYDSRSIGPLIQLCTIGPLLQLDTVYDRTIGPLVHWS